MYCTQILVPLFLPDPRSLVPYTLSPPYTTHTGRAQTNRPNIGQKYRAMGDDDVRVHRECLLRRGARAADGRAGQRVRAPAFPPRPAVVLAPHLEGVDDGASCLTIARQGFKGPSIFLKATSTFILRRLKTRRASADSD